MKTKTEVVLHGTFNGENHWYPKALHATIHPMVNFFLNLSKDRIINRYCHLNPMVSRGKFIAVLEYLVFGTKVNFNMKSIKPVNQTGGRILHLGIIKKLTSCLNLEL